MMNLIPEQVTASWTSFDPCTQPDQALLCALNEVTAGLNTLTALQLRILADIDARALAKDLGYGSTKDYFSRGARTNPGEANRLIALAGALRQFPATAAMFDAGDISAEHARAVIDSMNLIDDACPDLLPEIRLAAEQELLDVAITGTPNQVRERGKELLLKLAVPNLDDVPGEDTTRNRFDVAVGAAGRVKISGNVDSALGEKLLTALSPISKPVPGPLGEKDERSASLRRADGLGTIVDAYLGAGLGPHEGGVKPHLVLQASARDLAGEGDFAHGEHLDDCAESPATENPAGSGRSADLGDRIDLDGDAVGYGRPDETEPENPYLSEDFRDRGAYGRMFATPTPFRLEWLGPISRSAALLIACDCEITRIVLDDEGVPMWLGRSERVVTAPLRRALVARDRGCTLCGAPASWCRAHHVTFWSLGGLTDLDNLCLLCDRCHRMVHAGVWEIVFGSDGHPWFRPPRKRDPDRQLVPGFFRQARSTPQTV